MEQKRIENLLYFAYINSVGGVETFFNNVAEKYGDRDIMVVYRNANDKQLERLREKVRTVKFTGQKFFCRRAFFNYNADIIHNVDAEEYIQIIHADYEAQHMVPMCPDQINRYVAVSQRAADGFYAMTGIRPEVFYPPVVTREPRRILHLVSATRLTTEKGGWRIHRLARMLQDAGYPFEWQVFTDSGGADSDGLTIRKPTLDIADYIADADWLVQLSDTEAFCFSVAEALTLGTPVIVTDLPVYKELKLTKNNSIRLDLDMQDVPLEKIYEGLPRVKGYKPPADRWGDILLSGKSRYNEPHEVEALREFTDLESGVQREPGDRWTCTGPRASRLEDMYLVKIKERP